ncbi:nucleotidyltransferase family protein [Enterococcus gallinarum]|uniref:nucleotidyltransferase family protein n=1 Tax=Enterococcus gallinarum TaxID=1353 RepID=UPI0018ABAFB0|nr:nucleotidyltransferase domain-containing protein [Enterococcus gallinarum]
MVLTVEEIKTRVRPVAEKYEIPVVYIFGSYARNEATNESDIDFLVGTSGLSEKYRWSVYSDFFEELKEAVEREIDLVEIEAFDEPMQIASNREFFEKMMKERIKIFER